MKFIVDTKEPLNFEIDTVYLIKGSFYRGRYRDDWNDYGYYTIYTLLYCEKLQEIINVGCLKIGEFNMNEGQSSPNLPSEFVELNPDRFFSFSTDEEYYKKVSNIEHSKGYDILIKLNDFTVCRDVYEKAKNEKVTSHSLLREIREAEHESYINKFYQLLKPPINLTTMRRIFGSTGWDDVDSGLVEMQRLLFNANIHYYYNAIATIGREILKGIANKIYIDEIHRDKEKYPTPPNDDKYIIKLHSFIDYEYAEKNISENIKDYIKSTIILVQGYVHKEKAENHECYMCVHAVISLVFQLSIVCNMSKYNEVSE